MTVRIHLSFACLLSPFLLWPQQANVNLDYNPQKNTENLIPFSATLNSPDVRDDGTVTFRLKAPAAKEVLLSGVAILTALGKSGQSVPFTKGADGVWTLTVGPLKPDMYIYNFVVDGCGSPTRTTPLPASPRCRRTASWWCTARVQPTTTRATSRTAWSARHVYHSNVTNGERELYVYTPPGYDRSKRYPVLYLVGGSGDLPSNWVYDGRVNLMMDNLLAEDKAVPMVIAIPNNQVVHRNNPQHTRN